MEKIKIGFVPSHRNVFNEEWAIKMRERTINTLSKIDFMELVVPTKEITNNGLISDENDAKKAIKLFSESNIDALLIGTMTFGEELPTISIAEVFKDKPILLFGTKEGPFTTDGLRNSDSFCGTLSISSGLYRRDIPFLFLGIVFPEEEKFLNNLLSFVKTCNAVKGFLNIKVGLIGPKPYPFETCTINEMNLINKFGIRVQPISLISLNEDMEKINNNDKKVKKIIGEVKSKADCSCIEDNYLIKLAKMEIVLDYHISNEGLSSLALSCWPDIPSIINVSPCLVASRLTAKGIPTACEADIYGALTMYIQYLLSLGEKVPHFIDWTIQSQTDNNLFLSWHCGNAPMCLASRVGKISIKENSVGKKAFGEENTKGAVEFQLKSGLVSLNRLVEYKGKFKMLIAKGEILNKEMNLRGSWSWIKVSDLDKLYEILIKEGFIHHASIIYEDYQSSISDFCDILDIKSITV